MPAGEPRPQAKRRWGLGVALLGILFLATLAWFGLSVRSAYNHLTASRDDLRAARGALSATELGSAQEFFDAAAEEASAAAKQVHGPLWSLATVVPGVGATPKAVQSVATALDQALTALEPAVGQLAGLDPDSLVSTDGTVDVHALQDATVPLESAQDGIDAALQTLSAAPSRAAGNHVLGRVDDAATELGRQLNDLDGTLEHAIQVTRLVPPLLGVEGPKRYFVAILNPNEARGTGGFLGTYAIIRAQGGQITVEQIGSNSDLPNVPYTPRALGADFVKRYGDGRRLVPNLNISPHFPDAGLLWLKSWRVKTGEQLDGAISADVVALGDLVTATGEQLRLPDGTSMTGAQLTDFAVQGIYEQYPQGSDNPVRKAFQEALTRRAFDVVLASGAHSDMAKALGQALGDHRMQVWSTEAEVQEQLLDAGIGGSLEVPAGHHVAFVALNSSGSKLDAFLERSMTYEVGRCPSPQPGRVVSLLHVGLTNAIPEGAAVPDYMVSLAKRGPHGPINSAVVELYLPLGAEVLEVGVDGKSSQFQTFREQGRLAVVMQLDLPPRKERTVTVQFSEPADGGPGIAPEQPLAHEQETTIADEVCSAPAPNESPNSDEQDPDDPLGPRVPLGPDDD